MYSRQQRDDQQQPDLNNQMNATGKNAGDGDQFAWKSDALYQARVIDHGAGTRRPGPAEKIEWYQSAEQEHRKVRLVVLQHLSEDEDEDSQHDQRIQQGPKNAQRHISIANSE